MKRKPYTQSTQPPLARDERGFAMLWTLIAMMGLTFLGVAANHISSTERIISENFEVEQMGLYAADGAISQFLAAFVPIADITDPEFTYAAPDGDPSDELWVDALEEFSGADLVPRSYSYGLTSVAVTPIKLVESRFGDIYMVEATATITNAAGDVITDRVLRTFARLNPFMSQWGAMTAPNGVVVNAGSEHFHMDGEAKGACGFEDASPLTTPNGEADYAAASKKHIKPSEDDIDTSTDSYSELLDSLDMQVPWSQLTDPATYAGMDLIIIPDDYAELTDVPEQSGSSWPTVLVRGDLVLDGASKKVKNRGALIVEGTITVGPSANSKLDWRGTILSGEEMIVTGDAHLHAKGTVTTGLDCGQAAIDAGLCRNVLDGKHMGVTYQPCDAEAAMAQLLTLQQVTPSRHTRLY